MLMSMSMPRTSSVIYQSVSFATSLGFNCHVYALLLHALEAAKTNAQRTSAYLASYHEHNGERVLGCRVSGLLYLDGRRMSAT